MNDNLPAVVSETLLLLPHTVTDLDDFVARPEHYLMSVEAEPVRAAEVWLDRLKRNPYGSDGLIRLAYFGRDIFTADQWDDVDGLWHELVGLCHGFLADGRAESCFPGQPLVMSFERKGKIGMFRVGDDRVPVDPSDFIPGVLDSADRFFDWVEENVGRDCSEIKQQIRAARMLL
ncbi:MAG: hypothetical protein Q4G46_06935 [Propionibacteriaceae bacterium]|nr:hypothetical protein [Propionibacteriaceae bacterium]